VIENGDYYKLIRFYKGKLDGEVLAKEIEQSTGTVSSATLAYGLGNWGLCEGAGLSAVKLLKQITAGNQWASFGYIAAEADLKLPNRR